tara:strand:+ start:12992 stop:15094 length:2103 start_codon:yes stop_codon:yes gene_type:complete
MAREQDYIGQIENLKQISSLNAEILASEKIIEKTSGAVKKNQIEKAKALRAALKATKQQNAVLTSVNKKAKETAEGFKAGLEKIGDMVKDVPVIGTSLGKVFDPFAAKAGRVFDVAAHRFSSRFTSSFQAAQKGGAGFFKSFRAGVAGGTASLKSMSGMLAKLGPMFIAMGLLAALALAFVGFQKLEGAAKAVREETGLLNSQTKGLKGDIAAVTKGTAGLGASMEDVGKAAAAFINEFEGIGKPSKEVLESTVALEKNFGVAAADGAKLNSIFQQLGGLSAEAAQYQVEFTTQLAAAAGVAPSKVIKDIAENSEAAAMHFSGSVQDLTKAAVQAARLGTSIGQASKVAEGLLDFNNSINAELEASAMLGQSVNFNRARELAATGDIVKSQQAVLDQIQGTIDLDNLNYFQKQKLAEAAGMEFSEIQNQLNVRQKFGKMNADQQAAYDALIASGKDLNNISKTDLANQTQKIKDQKEMQSVLDNVANSFSEIGTQLVLAFAPIMEGVMPALEGVMWVVSGIVGFFTSMITMVGTVADYIRGWADALGPFAGMIKLVAAAMILMAAYAAYGALAWIPIVGPILGAATAAAIIGTGFSKLYGEAGDMASPADGKTQVSTKEGGLFQLSDNDDLVAAPGLFGGLFGNRGGGGGDNRAVVAAINTLGEDIRNLQVVVNMDGKKVTDGVSKVVSRSQSNNYGERE